MLRILLIASLGVAAPAPAQTPPSIDKTIAVRVRDKATIVLAEDIGSSQPRMLDVTGLDVSDPVLSSDGTALRVTIKTEDALSLTRFIDLTRKERRYGGVAIPEARAVREALEPVDPCKPAQGPEAAGVPRQSRSRRCIERFFTPASRVTPISGVADGWQYFRVTPTPALYLPALQLAPLEDVFPSPIDTLSQLKVEESGAVFHQRLHAYLAQPVADRKKDCTVYQHVTSYPGTWLIEFWFYFPFDSGGQGPHLHDSEHVFVEVDALGGWVRRVMGAGHGQLAGNNIYEAFQSGAVPADLPLLAMVELAKHATAPDIDRDFNFTPGIDENFYSERSKVWGVRDVIGNNNNHVMSYERTMSAPRLPHDVLAWANARQHHPAHPDLAEATCTCTLVNIEEAWPADKACGRDWKKDPSIGCAQQQIAGHDDHKTPANILKKWMYPPVALRASLGVGPRNALKTVGLGLALDVDKIPGVQRRIKLPGRIFAELQRWEQGVDSRDRDSCVQGCEQARGWGAGVRYEQLLSNLFGAYFGMRRFNADGGISTSERDAGEKRGGETWYVLGPMMEFPMHALGRYALPGVGNVNLQAGLAVRQTSSPRYEIRVNLGLYRFRAPSFGVPRKSTTREPAVTAPRS